MSCRLEGRAWRPMGFRALILIAAVALSSASARAAVQTYFFSGEVSASTFSHLPATTPFVGTYSLDDATADANGSAAVGDYATGAFHVDFGPAIGNITFDQSSSIRIDDNLPGSSRHSRTSSGSRRLRVLETHPDSATRSSRRRPCCSDRQSSDRTRRL